jgi:pyruvate dehydrogenase E2 component (dihydrolipoamide acetyltransferase)
MRLAIARAMARSNREIPHYYLATTIDLLPATTWLAQQNEQRPMEKRLLIGALFLKATAHALKEVPELNGWWKEEQLETSASVHIGVAISTRSGGLLIPAIHDVDRKPIDAVMADLADLVERARNGHLRSSELTDGTITVTSLGDRGVELVAGVIYPPQVALVGFGKVVRRPWAVGEDAVAIRPVVTATLAGDHRASDGHRGARFLVALERALAHPEAL